MFDMVTRLTVGFFAVPFPLPSLQHIIAPHSSQYLHVSVPGTDGNLQFDLRLEQLNLLPCPYTVPSFLVAICLWTLVHHCFASISKDQITDIGRKFW